MEKFLSNLRDDKYILLLLIGKKKELSKKNENENMEELILINLKKKTR